MSSRRKIAIARGVDAAHTAEGHVVVIDVLRAFTTAACAFGGGAREIVLVSTTDEAFALRDRARAGDRPVLIGEVGGRPIPGFDHGNSPAEVSALDLSGRTVVLRSSSGTQGVARAARARSLYLGSLVVATATARALASADVVTLLAMGSPYGPDGAEDDACADHLEALLTSGTSDRSAITARVLASAAAAQALDPAIDWIVPGDLERALEFDRYDFAMRVERRGDLLVARAVRDGVT